MKSDVKNRLNKALGVLCLLGVALLFGASLFIMQTDAQGALVFLLSLPLCALLLMAVMVLTAFIPPQAGRRGLRLAALAQLLVIVLFVAGHFVPRLAPFSGALVAATRWSSAQVLGMSPWDWANQAEQTGTDNSKK